MLSLLVLLQRGFNMRFRAKNTRDSAQGYIQCMKCIGNPVMRTDGRTDVRTDGHVTIRSQWSSADALARLLRYQDDFW